MHIMDEGDISEVALPYFLDDIKHNKNIKHNFKFMGLVLGTMNADRFLHTYVEVINDFDNKY